MTRPAPFIVAIAIAVGALLAARVSPAGAVAIKRCGAVAGPQARVGATALAHYGVLGINVDCSFARNTVAAIVKEHLPNSPTPTRAKGPGGWVCVAQEVDSHVAVAGHCQRGHAGAFSWVGVGLHL
jgi:hypothetical protein